ncbi:response regulator [Clostridium sp. MSJ-4]|uniref:Stage 0 sporulation protein A homolog n=1 Tax=Clostridium simiarum TaxID=2841506 RepID=A0ABS6F4I5_9CLOT|nr:MULTISPECIES: response regulator [Clostridium]MBU5592764.1 response regulator [Clostridium simiarum]
MEKVKVVIVDDSPFSISIIRDILEENGYDVVGEAGSLEEVKEIVKETRPNLVTMDMTLPGTDGIECTNAIHEIDGSIKVIVVSSMMDEEIVKKAKDNKVSGYIQKPIDPEELLKEIERVVFSEKLYEELQSIYFVYFKEAFADGLNKFTKTIAHFGEDYKAKAIESSRGISVVVGIIGNYSGRMILDLSQETAHNMAKVMLRREPKSLEETLNIIGEVANIISGNACSMINRKNKVFGLRVAPPTIFYGKCLNISQAMIEGLAVEIDTDFGQVYINIGFKRGE